MEINAIAKIHTPMSEKFGIPRQSGLAMELKGEIVFEKQYADPKAVEALDGYDYIWLIWEFEGVANGKAKDGGEKQFRAQIRPPRLGGNEYVGVFASRSPFRPNPLGLSCVRLDKIEYTDDRGPVLHVSGVDMRDGTPIFDIKPYIPYADSHPEARGGFTDWTRGKALEVVFDDMDGTSGRREGINECATVQEDTEKGLDNLQSEDRKAIVNLKAEDKRAIVNLLSQDPRPAYHDDPMRIYGMRYKDTNIKFRVDGNTVYVIGIEKVDK